MEHRAAGDDIDQSFVPPLNAPDATDVPDQRAAAVTGSGDPGFVRPPSDDIDFAAVIRRSDLSRASLRAAWSAIAVGALAVIAFLLTQVLPIAVLAVVCGVVAIGAALLRLRLLRAPVPRLNR